MSGTARTVEVRIRDGGSRGVLEMNIDGGGWGAVCDDGFDAHAANAVCLEMGFEGGTSYDTTHGNGSFAVDDLSCPSGAAGLSACRTGRAPYSHNCGDDETVGIDCNGWKSRWAPSWAPRWPSWTASPPGLEEIGALVVLTDGYASHGDASGGPLKPGDEGKVVEAKGGGGRVRVRALTGSKVGKDWWYDQAALRLNAGGLWGALSSGLSGLSGVLTTLVLGGPWQLFGLVMALLLMLLGVVARLSGLAALFLLGAFACGRLDSKAAWARATAEDGEPRRTVCNAWQRGREYAAPVVSGLLVRALAACVSAQATWAAARERAPAARERAGAAARAACSSFSFCDASFDSQLRGVSAGGGGTCAAACAVFFCAGAHITGAAYITGVAVATLTLGGAAALFLARAQWRKEARIRCVQADMQGTAATYRQMHGIGCFERNIEFLLKDHLQIVSSAEQIEFLPQFLPTPAQQFLMLHAQQYIYDLRGFSREGFARTLRRELSSISAAAREADGSWFRDLEHFLATEWAPSA